MVIRSDNEIRFTHRYARRRRDVAIGAAFYAKRHVATRRYRAAAHASDA